VSHPGRTVVWIVSYPKSGNTWVRFLVCNLVFGLQDSAAALNRLAPDIHELGAPPEPPAAPVFLKTHFPFSPGLPLAEHTAGAIYVVRDPADVMLSNFHYSKRTGTTAAENQTALDHYVDRYLSARGDPRWLELQMGAWDDHVHTWLATKHPFPVLPLRYEDLLADGLQGAKQICSFLGLGRTDEEIQRAVAGSSFQRMMEIEEADIRSRNVGIFYKPYLQPSIASGLRFMRAGKAGEGARALSPDQRRRLSVAFGPLMRELGYENTSAPPA
jgi:hypothetical protein